MSAPTVWWGGGVGKVGDDMCCGARALVPRGKVMKKAEYQVANRMASLLYFASLCMAVRECALPCVARSPLTCVWTVDAAAQRSTQYPCTVCVRVVGVLRVRGKCAVQAGVWCPLSLYLSTPLLYINFKYEKVSGVPVRSLTYPAPHHCPTFASGTL